MSSGNLDAQSPATPPVARPGWGDVVNDPLRRAMAAAAAAALVGAAVTIVVATRAGWGEVWTQLVLPACAVGGAVYLVAAAAGLTVNRWSARRFGRSRGLASTDVMMVVPGTFVVLYSAAVTLWAAVVAGAYAFA